MSPRIRIFNRLNPLMMKTRTTYGFALLMLLAMACASGPRSQATPAELAAFEKLISDKSFQIDASWAQPMASQGLNSIANAGLLPRGSTASRIDIGGSGGYLRVVGDSVMADLPYFGERQMGGAYNPQKGGIQFNGIPKEFTLEPNKKGDGKTVRFNITHDQEAYRVIAQIYPSNFSSITIASTHRTTIWYQGTVSEYDPEK
ncbi:MAG: hypothetical protein DSY83_03950 [Flavobacteriia bacterium]|nr:MAG: hypothetical protein DSY83_03950 [Flavobacteriia bacterium]